MTATLGVDTLPVDFVIATAGAVLNLGVGNTICTIGGTGRFRRSGGCDAAVTVPGTGSDEAVINGVLNGANACSMVGSSPIVGVVNGAEVFQKMPSGTLPDPLTRSSMAPRRSICMSNFRLRMHQVMNFRPRSACFMTQIPSTLRAGS